MSAIENLEGIGESSSFATMVTAMHAGALAVPSLPDTKTPVADDISGWASGLANTTGPDQVPVAA